MDQRQKEDLALLMDPTQWPLQICLPVKRYGDKGSWPEFGTILLGDTKLVLQSSIDKLLSMPMAELPNVPKQEYETHEALIADGWVVD